MGWHKFVKNEPKECVEYIAQLKRTHVYKNPPSIIDFVSIEISWHYNIQTVPLSQQQHSVNTLPTSPLYQAVSQHTVGTTHITECYGANNVGFFYE